MHTRSGQCVLGGHITAVIFGVEGVVVDSARTSAAAWKTVLDPFLRTYAAACEIGFQPFDVRADYLRYMYGRPRLAGARDFLTARDMRLPYDDLRGLSVRQEEFFLAEIRRHGVCPFASAVTLIRETRRRGLRTAAVSPQCHGHEVLRKAGVAAMFDLVLDGLDAPGTGLPAGPDTAMYLQAAMRLGASPGHTAVIEETVAGITAARRGGFGLVVGVDRLGGAPLREHGADVIVSDLADLRLHGRRHAA